MNNLAKEFLFDGIPGAFGFKDVNSNYIYGNNQLAYYMGYPMHTSLGDI